MGEPFAGSHSLEPLVNFNVVRVLPSSGQSVRVLSPYPFLMLFTFTLFVLLHPEVPGRDTVLLPDVP
jgi:hypothetical protein